MKRMSNSLWKTCSRTVDYRDPDFHSLSSRYFIHDDSTEGKPIRNQLDRLFHYFTGTIISIIFFNFYNLIRKELRTKSIASSEKFFSIFSLWRFESSLSKIRA